jgi:hypothetical protein
MQQLPPSAKISCRFASNQAILISDRPSYTGKTPAVARRRGLYAVTERTCDVLTIGLSDKTAISLTVPDEPLDSRGGQYWWHLYHYKEHRRYDLISYRLPQ